MNNVGLRRGGEVRVWNMNGPCLKATLSRINAKTCTVMFSTTKTYVNKDLVHGEPCLSCTDHPNSSYADGSTP